MHTAEESKVGANKCTPRAFIWGGGFITLAYGPNAGTEEGGLCCPSGEVTICTLLIYLLIFAPSLHLFILEFLPPPLAALCTNHWVTCKNSETIHQIASLSTNH